MKIIFISMFSFFMLNNNFEQIYIKCNWVNENLFKTKTENQEDQLNKVSKLSMIYYPNSKCMDCKEIVIEFKENGVFTIKHENTNEGFDIHQGRLNNYGIEKFKKLTLNSLVHKYPKHDFSNRRKFVSSNGIKFYFLIHINGEIRKVYSQIIHQRVKS